MHESQSEHEDRGVPILVARDVLNGNQGTGMIFAHVVPKKGVQPYAVKAFANDVALLGHPELIIKSDGEPSIEALTEAVKNERAERIVLEQSPVHESKSNGRAENTVQLVQGQVRTIKDGLESRIGVKITGDMPIVTWLVIHAARTLNRFVVVSDGKTACRRWKGKEFKRDVVEFGESVMYLKAGTRGVDKFAVRWEKGVWLGIRDETGEVIIGTNEGVVKARDMKIMPTQEERWHAEAILVFQGTPWEPIPGKKYAIPVRVQLPEEGSDEKPKPVNLGEPKQEI